MDRIRRSMLFIPGNNPGMLQNGDVFGADSIIIDLEDSVALDEKDAARNLVKQFISTFRYQNTEIVVRINPFGTDYYHNDVAVIGLLPIDTILLPKADIESIINLDRLLNAINSPIKIMVLIETTEGVESVYQVLKSSPRCVGMMLGGEDLCVDLGCERSKEGMEILYARTRVVNASRALKKMVIDTPFTDTNDDSGLLTDALFAKKIGFDGKAAINPRQIEGINSVFNPTEKEIIHAQRVLEAKELAIKEGKGVFSLDGKMVDLPIILRAEKTLAKASKIGLIGCEKDDN